MSAADEVKKEVTDTFTHMFGAHGLSPTISRLYMELFFSDEPLGLRELSDRTGYSISTVCANLDMLEKFADIKKSKKPGSKKIFYECEHDIISTQKKKFSQGKKMIQGMVEQLKTSEEKLSTQETTETKHMREHITKMRQDYEFLDNMFDKINAVYAETIKQR